MGCGMSKDTGSVRELPVRRKKTENRRSARDRHVTTWGTDDSGKSLGKQKKRTRDLAEEWKNFVDNIEPDISQIKFRFSLM